MTVWLAGHYGGWKAAIAGAAVTDWVDQYNFGDINVGRAGAIGGSPWVGDNMKKYVAQSPITEAKNIKAPTLILANTADPRVPVTQSYKLYHTLIDNGTITKFIGWPIPAHNATDPITLMQRDRLWVNWLNTYFQVMEAYIQQAFGKKAVSVKLCAFASSSVLADSLVLCTLNITTVSNDLINTKYTNKHLKKLMTLLSGMVQKPDNLNTYGR